MISTSTTLSTTISGAIPTNEYAALKQPVKSPSVFSNQKGADSFIPGRTLISSLFESYEDNTVGQGEFVNNQSGSVFNTANSPTFIVPKSNQTSPSFENVITDVWLTGKSLLVKTPTQFVTLGPMYDPSTFFLNTVFLPITVSQATMQSAANNVSTQTIRQYWS